MCNNIVAGTWENFILLRCYQRTKQIQKAKGKSQLENLSLEQLRSYYYNNSSWVDHETSEQAQVEMIPSKDYDTLSSSDDDFSSENNFVHKTSKYKSIPNIPFPNSPDVWVEDGKKKISKKRKREKSLHESRQRKIGSKKPKFLTSIKY
eukprot:TRINITY_DN465_c0_g1_i2.p1 TRINITY_DN465_c0_g1~~TRINITY_DN465_c0_g1_i2.p1  ORF type:complete len:149 (+),score=26.25 TRINITY_DN465_c0_g1_i2:269-715(+)